MTAQTHSHSHTHMHWWRRSNSLTHTHSVWDYRRSFVGSFSLFSAFCFGKCYVRNTKTASRTHARHSKNWVQSCGFSAVQPFFFKQFFLLFPMLVILRKLKWWSTHVLTHGQRNVNCSRSRRIRDTASPVHRFPNWRMANEDGSENPTSFIGKSRMEKRGEREREHPCGGFLIHKCFYC